jgi:dihydrofolate synthase/folylpolyglutamate synthase
MSYSAAIESLFQLAGELQVKPGEPRRKFRLEDMRVLLRGLGDPQERFRSVLIAGTNGKGSTASTLASVLVCAGYKTGLYTSPHLCRVNERVRLNGALISDDDFARHYFRVDEVAARLVREGQLPAHPSFFESMTALAFLYFAEQRVDLAVLEVGMGGRLDATNVVEPLISVITDISLDHTEWLGSTIAAIAREKAGILRRNGVMVTLPQHPEANQVLGEVAVALNTRGVNAAVYMPAQHQTEGHAVNRYPLMLGDEVIEVDSPLAGTHQQRNIALAVAAAVELRNNDGYIIADTDIEEGIRNTVWPGRLERFPADEHGAAVLLDVAHNPAGAWALRAALSGENGREMTLVFGCLKDKPYTELAQILFPRFDRVLLAQVDSPRAAAMEDMAAAAEATGVPFERHASAEAALETARRVTPIGGLIVVTGSVYLVGKVRGLLVGQGVCQ